MTQFICMFCTSFISLMLYRKFFYRRRKEDLIHFISYYFLCVLVNNFIMNGILVIFFKENITTYNYVFMEKYLLISSFIAITLPLLFSSVKELCCDYIFSYYELIEDGLLFIIKQLKNSINNFFKLDITKKIINYLKEHWKDIIISLIFIIIIVLQFLIFDKVIREVIYKQIAFYSVDELTPNILTMTYGFICGVVLILLSKKIGKFIIPFSFIINLLLFIVNYMLILIKSEAFSVYTLQIASEGLSYINYVTKYIDIYFILIIFVTSSLFFVSYSLYKKINLNLSIDIKTLIITFCFILFIILRFNGLDRLEDYHTKGGWEDITYPSYYIEHLINSRKNVSVLGLYEYTVRDILNYIKNETSTYGDVSKIEKVINNSEFETTSNDMTGLFKDKNLIMIMMESIDNVVVDYDTMPTLSMIMDNGLNFTKRYSQLNSGGSTIATEYTTLSGLFYSYNNKYDINTYREAIPYVFSNNGYKVSSFHENYGVYYNRIQLHKSLGFKNTYFLKDMDYAIRNYNDSQFFDDDYLYDLVVPKTGEKFMSFIVTISAHGPYKNNGICINNGYNEEKECLKYLSKRTDDMLKLMLERLKEDGLLEDTVIILYSDHAAYSYNYTEEELLNTYEKINDSYDIKNLPFVIYNSEISGNRYDDIIVNDVDFAPTIFNLFGIDYDARYYVGTDVFANYHKNVCIFKDHTWYDGGLNTSLLSETLEQDMFNYVVDRLEFSRMLISNNYYK